jgi:FixJ family two-component response regulator
MVEQARVFLIDDDPSVLRALERFLKSSGFRVDAFTSPAAFLERQPYTEGPGCLLLDLRMPGVSGLDLQQIMGQQGISMPIVFLSAQADVPSAARAMREGAVDFLVKPVDGPAFGPLLVTALAVDRWHQSRTEEETDRRPRG